MKNPTNRFKSALAQGKPQTGIWNSIGGNTVPEMLASTGFDWMLIDTEHSAVDVLDVLPALQTLSGFPNTSAVVRPAINDPVIIKRLLDFGAQTLLIPYVQSPDEARAAVAAMSYPPHGIRGVAGVTRATRFGRVENYAATAQDELCLLVQVETAEALAQLDDIATVKGVDGVFIGPADLSTSMGYAGQTGHPAVVEAIEGAIRRLGELGVPAGILTPDRDFARRCIELGAGFTAVGIDLLLLNDATIALAQEFGLPG